MPASRLVFVLTDLMSELKALSPKQSAASLTLDRDTHQAVIQELKNHFGKDVVHDPSLSDHCAKFCGMDLICGPDDGVQHADG